MKEFLKLRSEVFGLDANDLSIKIAKLKKEKENDRYSKDKKIFSGNKGRENYFQ